MKPKTASLLILFMIVISSMNNGVHAGCLDDILDCLGLVGERRLNYDELDKELKEYSDMLLREGYAIINKNLIRTVVYDDLGANLDQVKEFLRTELSHKYSKGLLSFLNTRPSLTQQLATRDRDLMINSLIRLLHLEEADPQSHRTKCNGQTTNNLILNNRIVFDPIGRQIQGKRYSSHFDRISGMVFDASVNKARHCLGVNRHKIIRRYVGMPDDEEIMRNYWDRVFQHRFRKEFRKDLNVDSSFLNYPKQILLFVETMPHAIEADEVGIALEIFKEAAGRKSNEALAVNRSAVNDFRRYLQMPCSNFVTMTSGIYQSLDFDLRLRKFIGDDIAEATDMDDEVNRQRAYLLMCKKLVNEEKYFSEFYEEYRAKH